MELVRIIGDMKYKTLFLTVFVVLGISVGYAQEMPDSAAVDGNNSPIDSTKLFNHKNQKEVSANGGKGNKVKQDKMSPADWAAKVDSLKACLAGRDSVILSLKSRMVEDSIYMTVQNDSLEARASRIKYWEDMRGRIDTCMISLANRWLFVRFNKDEIDKAISYFERITSAQLKEDRKQILVLLKEYEDAYISFSQLMLSAQKDPRRESAFDVKEFKEDYISRIHEMPYYKKYYKSGWSIRFLDGIIAQAIKKLEEHENKFADFSDLFIVEQKLLVEDLGLN